MSKSTKAVLLLLILAIASSLASILLKADAAGHPVARITRNGELLQEIELDRVSVPYSFTVEDGAGHSNTIQVEHGRIRISEADCPDQICVEQGFISDGTVPIVCLPHRLIIEIVGGGEDLDAATG